MKTRKPLSFETLPSWTIDGDKKDRHTVAAAFELAGLTGKWGPTQSAQRNGNCSARPSSANAKSRLRQKESRRGTQGFASGTDFDSCSLTWVAVENRMGLGRPLVEVL